MPANSELALNRLIPRRSWTDNHGRGLLLWVALFTLAIAVGFVLVTLLTDFLVVQSTGFHSQDVGSTNGDSAGLSVQAKRFGGQLAWSWLPRLVERLPGLQDDRSSLVALAVSGLLIAVFLMVSRAAARHCAMQSAEHSALWLRNAIHRQTLRLGPSDLTGQRYQAAYKLFTDDVDEIADALANYRRRIVRGAMLVPVLLITILAINWRLGIQCLVPTAFCWFVYRFERKKGAAQRQLAEAHAETEARFLADGLKQTRLVRGYNMEDFEQTLFEKHLDRHSSRTQKGYQLESGALRFARIVVVSCMAVILLLISLRVISTTAPIALSSGIVFGIALGILYREVSSLEETFALRQQLHIWADRIYRYLDEIPEVGQAVGAKFIQPVARSIVYEAVHYAHQGHQILQGVDLRIEAKTQTALVSLDPLMPRAAAYMLPRFIEPSKGRVLFDGEDIAWGTLESIHAETVYVGGDDPVLAGTVMENLICGDTRYTKQDAIEAAKLVHANKYLSSLPLGYETVIGERGESFGVGQAFQLGLARAVLRNPAVIIIQEPEMILEEELRAAIDDAYQRIATERTIIYLPTRLSTIRRAENVVVLHEGRVEAIGSHQELLKSSELYRHWDYMTFNAFSRASRRPTQ